MLKLIISLILIHTSLFFNITQPNKSISAIWFARKKYQNGLISFLKYPESGRSFIVSTKVLEISLQDGSITERHDNPQLYINLHRYNGPFLNNTLLYCQGSMINSACSTKSFGEKQQNNYTLVSITQNPVMIQIVGQRQVFKIFEKDQEKDYTILFFDGIWMLVLVYWLQSLQYYKVNQWIYTQILIISFFSIAPLIRQLNYGLQLPQERYRLLYLIIVVYGFTKILFCIFTAMTKQKVELECFCKVVIYNIMALLSLSSNLLYFVFGSAFLVFSVFIERNKNVKMSQKYPLSMILIMNLVFLKYNYMQNCNYLDEITLFQSKLITILIWSSYGVLWAICRKDKDPFQVQFLSYSNHENDCAICLTIIEGQAAKTPCGHLFHYQCLKNWCQMKGQCPIDRNIIHFPIDSSQEEATQDL